MNPEFEDETPVNPFDLWEGANFKLKIRKVEGYPNYDKSEFDKIGPLTNDDAELEAIWKKEHSLQSFLDASNFKSYDELQAKLMKVLDEKAPQTKVSKKAEDEDLPWDEETPAPKQKAAPAKQLVEEDDDDESLEFFKNLANAR